MLRRLHTSSPQLRSLNKHNLTNAISLPEFLFRQKVKQVYRDVLRMIYKSHQKEGLLEYARGEFRVKGVGATEGRDGDLGHRKYLLNVGIQRVGEMAATISSTVSVSKQLGRIQQVKELL